MGQRYASTAFTLDAYAHVLPHMQDEAAATMEAMLFLATVSRIVTIRGSAPDTIEAIAIDVIGCRNLITNSVVSRTRLFQFRIADHPGADRISQRKPVLGTDRICS